MKLPTFEEAVRINDVCPSPLTWFIEKWTPEHNSLVTGPCEDAFRSRLQLLIDYIDAYARSEERKRCISICEGIASVHNPMYDDNAKIVADYIADRLSTIKEINS